MSRPHQDYNIEENFPIGRMALGLPMDVTIRLLILSQCACCVL